jgi:hypothetical protein
MQALLPMQDVSQLAVRRVGSRLAVGTGMIERIRT